MPTKKDDPFLKLATAVEKLTGNHLCAGDNCPNFIGVKASQKTFQVIVISLMGVLCIMAGAVMLQLAAFKDDYKNDYAKVQDVITRVGVVEKDIETLEIKTDNINARVYNLQIKNARTP